MERALAGQVVAARRVTCAPVSHGRGRPQGPLGTAVGGSRRGGAWWRAPALRSTHRERPRRPWQGRRRQERRRRREHQGPGRQTAPGRMQLTALRALPLSGWQSSRARCMLSACAAGSGGAGLGAAVGGTGKAACARSGSWPDGEAGGMSCGNRAGRAAAVVCTRAGACAGTAGPGRPGAGSCCCDGAAASRFFFFVQGRSCLKGASGMAVSGCAVRCAAGAGGASAGTAGPGRPCAGSCGGDGAAASAMATSGCAAGCSAGWARAGADAGATSRVVASRVTNRCGASAPGAEGEASTGAKPTSGPSEAFGLPRGAR